MSRSGQKREKYGKSGELLLAVNCNEGTAARTRPLSFDDIMNKRKSKTSSENVKEGAIEVGNIGDSTIEKVSDHYDSERHHRRNKDSSPGLDKHMSEELEKAGSKKKEDKTSTKDGNSVRRKDRGSHESGNKLKNDNLSRSKQRENLQSEIRLKDGSLAKEKYRESHGSETKLKAEMKEGFSKAKGRADKQIPGEGRIYERSSDNSKDEATNKHSRDLSRKDTHVDRRGEKSARESKRKYRNGDDEKNGGKSSVKKHDIGKGHNLEISERRDQKESPKSHYVESKQKRRRSRSREREDRNRRSISPLARAHKRASYYGRENEELSAHSSKGRSGRQLSDIDRSRVTSNGSSSHYRRHGGSTSGLGGYSPRKRRTDDAVKTPSPVIRSPEKKSAKWDVAPAEKDSILSDSVPSSFQISNQNGPPNVQEVVKAIPITSTATELLTGVSVIASLTKQNVSIDSAQLTQATRPTRRLHVENVPASASEKSMMEFFNNFMLSLGVNHIHGSLPCISCIMQKEKGQALVEFLTPEDASAALSCDGSSFYGSLLKIRRPKDYIEVASGEVEKSVAAVDAISDVVKDSPHKIFIGGISKTLSSKMVMEIASAFGPVKAYHFEVNEDHDDSFAFLEFVDQSVTLKACAGLNGMKLGGQVLTVVQAIPDGLSSENCGSSPFYGIPEHATPLLKKPTQVLKLKNVFNAEGLTSLSDLEVQEVLEDVRLECARFGTVKSVNFVKYGDSYITNVEECEGNDTKASAQVKQNLSCDNTNEKVDSLEDVIIHQSKSIVRLDFPEEAKEVTDIDEVEEGNGCNDNKPGGDLVDEPCQPGKLDSNLAVENAQESISEGISQEICEQPNTVKDVSCCHDDKVASNTEMEDISLDNKSLGEEDLNLEGVNKNLEEASAGLDGRVEIQSNAPDSDDIDDEKRDQNVRQIFERGCVFVEYRRSEASCMAAHCLHGRLFDDRIVTVEYVPLDIYRKMFPK